VEFDPVRARAEDVSNCSSSWDREKMIFSIFTQTDPKLRL
jgi:hypothetical protein